MYVFFFMKLVFLPKSYPWLIQVSLNCSMILIQHLFLYCINLSLIVLALMRFNNLSSNLMLAFHLRIWMIFTHIYIIVIKLANGNLFLNKIYMLLIFGLSLTWNMKNRAHSYEC